MSTQQEAQERADRAWFKTFDGMSSSDVMKYKHVGQGDFVNGFLAGEISGHQRAIDEMSAKCEYGNWYEAYIDDEKTRYIIPDYKIKRFEQRELELLAKIELQDKRIAELEASVLERDKLLEQVGFNYDGVNYCQKATDLEAKVMELEDQLNKPCKGCGA